MENTTVYTAVCAQKNESTIVKVGFSKEKSKGPDDSDTSANTHIGGRFCYFAITQMNVR